MRCSTEIQIRYINEVSLDFATSIFYTCKDHFQPSFSKETNNFNLKKLKTKMGNR